MRVEQSVPRLITGRYSAGRRTDNVGEHHGLHPSLGLAHRTGTGHEVDELVSGGAPVGMGESKVVVGIELDDRGARDALGEVSGRGERDNLVADALHDHGGHRDIAELVDGIEY